MIREIHDFRKLGGPPQTVTAVSSDAVDAFLGAHNRRERTVHLRGLRDRGLLICHRRGLRQRLLSGMLAYVFRGPADRVPRIRERPLTVGWV